MNARQFRRLGARALDREEGLTCVTPGWRGLVARAYDLVEATPGVALCWVSQRQGYLWLEVTPRPAPAHVLWRLAAIERLSGLVCQVCALRGKLCAPTEPVHWLTDDARILCPFHGDCYESGVGLNEMLDERLAILTHAPDEARPLLSGDIALLSPAEYREQLLWVSESVPAADGDGFVFPGRVSWVLAHATDAQLAACVPQDLEPFFGWDEAPDVREAAMGALARLEGWSDPETGG